MKKITTLCCTKLASCALLAASSSKETASWCGMYQPKMPQKLLDMKQK